MTISEEQLKDCDRRLLSLEMKTEVHEAELASLRASRHEYANWLNRHNLEIQGIMQKQSEFSTVAANLNANISKVSSDLNALQMSFITEIAKLKSDVRQNTWVVSAIVGLIVFFARYIAGKLGF